MKEFHLAKSIIASNFGTNELPYKLTFIVTYKCNSKCTTCNIWRKKSVDELTLSEIDSFFKENPYFQWIDVSGGEIFLRKDIVDIMDIIIRRCKNLYCLHFPTNGLMTKTIVDTTKAIKKLKPYKLIISVSIDGPPEIHDKIRGVGGGFCKTVETYKELRAIKGVEVYAGMTLSEDNIDYFEETYDALQSRVSNFSYKDLHVNIASSSSFYYEKQIEISSEKKVIDTISKFMKLKKISVFNPVSMLEFAYLKKIEQYITEKRSPMSCHSLDVSLFLDPFGNIYPCNAYDKKIGNIREKGFTEIWFSSKRKNLSKEIRNLQCPQCWTPCEAYQTILASLIKKKIPALD